MKKYLLIPVLFCIMTATAIAASIDATVSPTSVAPNGDLTLTVKTSGVPDGRWAVTYEVDITGGCTRSGNTQISGFTLNDVGEDKTDTYTIKAPSSAGSCKFDVTYQFTQDTEKTTSASATIRQAEVQPPAPQQPQEAQQPPAQEPPKQEATVVEEQQKGSNAGLIAVIVIVVIGIIIFVVVAKKKK